MVNELEEQEIVSIQKIIQYLGFKSEQIFLFHMFHKTA